LARPRGDERRIGSRRGVRGAILVLALAWSGTAHAQSSATRVEVVAVGDPALVDSLEVVVRDLLSTDTMALAWSVQSGLETSEILREPVPDPNVLARAWIDLSDRERWRLYIADGLGHRFLVRVLARGESSDEVLRESLGRIVASTLHALRAGVAIGTERAIAEGEVRAAMGAPEPEPELRAAPPDAIAPPLGRDPEMRFGLFYEGALIDEAPVFQHGPGITFAIAGGPPSDASVWAASISAAWLVPLEWDRGSYGARFDGAAFRADVSAELRLAELAAFQATAGLGADVFWFAPRSGSEAMPLPPRAIALPIARAAFGFLLRIERALLLAVRLGCDFDLSGTQYTAMYSGGMVPVLTPSIARPFLHAGVSFAWP
jgi:hypothetical protein